MDSIKMSKAFTLAEVLITLAIIGVVAALTIPTVVTNYQARALETQRKKAKSVLANGFRLLMAGDGVATFRDTKMASCEGDKTCLTNEVKRVFNVILDNNSEDDIFTKDYYFDSGSRPLWTNNKIDYAFVTSDGMIFGVEYANDGGTSIITDVNGAKNPNKGGDDVCRYDIESRGAIFEDCSAMNDWGVILSIAECGPGHCTSCRTGKECTMAGCMWDRTETICF